MLKIKRESQITFMHSEALDRIPGIVHGFSTRRAERNDFTLGPLSSPNPVIPMNRARFLAAVGAPGWPMLKLQQMHSAKIHEVDDTKSTSESVEADAAITSLYGVLLGVQTADCVPILITHSSGRCVGAIHAGWRGTAAHIADLTVQRMTEKFGIKPEDLLVAIVPHIGVCCYEVGPEVVDAVADPDAIEHRPEWPKPHLSLAAANRKQLCSAGIPASSIDTTSLCTRCRSDMFFSYRSVGERAGRMLSVIGVAP
jgi:YfiH family protein